MSRPTPLEGLIVTELGTRIGAAVCGSMLAQLGASVVVPERPGSVEGKWRHRAQTMAGKLSLAVDPAKPDDAARLSALVARSDVLLLSSDVDPAPWPRDPSRIDCDVTAFGDSGPLSARPFSDAQVQALSGILDTTGLDEGPPTPIRLPIVEYMTGVYAAAACLGALRVRKAGGGGQAIDMALYDCAFAAMSTFLPKLLDGSDSRVGRVGNRHAMASPWNVYQASDGWVLVCAASDVQWRRICQVAGRPELGDDPRYLRVADRVGRFREVDAVVQAWVGTGTIARSIEILGGVGIPCGPVAKVEGCPQEGNLAHRGMVRRLLDPVRGGEIFVPASPLRMSATAGLAPERIPDLDQDRDEVARLIREGRPDAARARVGSAAAPLAGLRVIEIGHYTTAPLSARHLANLGADVIKIEPLGGEAVRNWAPAKKGTGLFFTLTNADKRSLALDLETEDGIRTLLDLIADSDVLVENLKPGALAKRGCSAQDIERINPRLIYCAVSGFGADTIYAGRPAYDTVIQAMSGFMDLTRAGDVPVKSGISSADLMGAEMAVLAILAALEARDRTGAGQSIDLSMQDVAAWLTAPLWNADRSAPRPIAIEAQDGFVVVELEASQDETDLPREAGADAARGLSRADLASLLSEAGWRAAPILTAREMLDAPQTRARHLLLEGADEDGEPWPLLASPLRLKGTPPVVRRPMRALGSDGPAILAEFAPRQRSGLPRQAAAGL